MASDDWTPQQVISALNEKNIKLPELIKREQIRAGDFYQLEQAIAKALNTPLDKIWPSRYQALKPEKG